MGNIQIKTFSFNPFQENTFVVYSGNDCIIVDPGNSNNNELEALKTFIIDNNLVPRSIVLTHGHIDHIVGVDAAKETYNIEVYMHAADIPIVNNSTALAEMFGFTIEKAPEIEHYFEDNQMLNFGEVSFKIIHVPGHSPGGVALFFEEDKELIAGDILFNGSIGRTDLPGGDHDSLISGIKEKLFCLDDNVTVHSGHGPITKIGQEKLHNPFLN